MEANALAWTELKSFQINSHVHVFKGEEEFFNYFTFPFGAIDFIFYFILFYFIFLLFRAEPAPRGGSQARGQIGVVAAGLRHSHSNAGSETHL